MIPSVSPPAVPKPGEPVLVKTPEGPALEVSVQFFLHKILPPLPPDTELDDLIENKLRGGTRSAPITMHGRLWGYNKKNPSGMHRNDVRKVYAHLASDVRAFIRSVEGHEKALVFRNNPEDLSDLRDRDQHVSLPDAYMVQPSAPSDSIQWRDIAVVGEYRRLHGKGDGEEVRLLYLASVSQDSRCSVRTSRR